MSAWQDSIDIKLEIAFGNKPGDTSLTWTDVSTYRERTRVRRGKRTETGGFQPSTLEVTLTNDDRLFDPDHASGTYFGDLQPMTPIRLTATLAAASATLFFGYITAFPQEWGQSIGKAKISAVDGTNDLSNAPLNDSAYAAAILADDPSHYWPFQTVGAVVFPDEIGGVDIAADTELVNMTTDLTVPIGAAIALSDTLAFNDRTITTQPKAVSAWFTFSTNPNERIAAQIPSAKDPFAGMSIGSGQVAPGELNVSYYNPDGSGLQHTFSTATGVKTPTDGKPHHVAAYADATNVYLYLDAELVYTGTLTTGTTSSTLGIAILDGDNSALTNGISHLAAWSTALTPTQIGEHYRAGLLAYGGRGYDERTGTRIGRVLDEIGWPSSRRNLDTGISICGPYRPNGMSAAAQIRELEAAEQGLAFFDVDGDFTFLDRQTLATTADTGTVLSDDGAAGSVIYYDLKLDAADATTVENIVTASYDNVGGITRRDATSVEDFLARRRRIPSNPLPDGNAASSIAAYRLRLRKDPQTRIKSVKVDIRDDPTDHFGKIATIEIGNVVTLERTPMGVGAQSSYRLMVVGIGHEITAERWTTTLYLTPAVPADTAAPYLILGDDTYGRIGPAFADLSTDNDDYSTPDLAAFDTMLAGDWCAVFRVRLADYTPNPSAVDLFVKTGAVQLEILGSATGTLRLTYNGTGSADSTTGNTLTDDTAAWLAVAWDADNGASSSVAYFWQATATTNDPTELVAANWTAIGSAVTVGSLVTFSDNANAIQVGDANPNPTDRYIFRAAWFSTVDGSFKPVTTGTPVLEMVPADIRAGTASPAWTAAGSAAIKGGTLVVA